MLRRSMAWRLFAAPLPSWNWSAFPRLGARSDLSPYRFALPRLQFICDEFALCGSRSTCIGQKREGRCIQPGSTEVLVKDLIPRSFIRYRRKRTKRSKSAPSVGYGSFAWSSPSLDQNATVCGVVSPLASAVASSANTGKPPPLTQRRINRHCPSRCSPWQWAKRNGPTPGSTTPLDTVDRSSKSGRGSR
jgi:hypothetical protein